MISMVPIYVICRPWSVRNGKNCTRKHKKNGTVFPNTHRPRSAKNMFIFFFTVLLWKRLLCRILIKAVQSKIWSTCAFHISSTKSDTVYGNCKADFVFVSLCAEYLHLTLFYGVTKRLKSCQS